MSISISSPVTGGAQTGLTSPTATYAVDAAPDTNGKQFYVSALGGTQTNARTHGISDPFIALFVAPKAPKRLPNPNPVTGLYGNVPVNTTRMKVTKGVKIATDQVRVMTINLEINVPAGADSFDAVNVRAAMSAFIGLLNSQSAGLGDSVLVGSLG